MRTSEVRISVLDQGDHRAPAPYLFDVSYGKGSAEPATGTDAETDEEKFFNSLEALIAHGTGALVVVR